MPRDNSDSGMPLCIEDIDTELRKKAEQLENRVRELEYELSEQSKELNDLRAARKVSEKDFVSSLSRTNLKDAEIVALKAELKQRDQVIAALQEKEAAFEKRQSESTAELAQRHAQIVQLTQRYKAVLSDHKRLENSVIDLSNKMSANASLEQELRAKLEAAKTCAEKSTSLERIVAELSDRICELEGLNAGAASESDQLDFDESLNFRIK